MSENRKGFMWQVDIPVVFRTQEEIDEIEITDQWVNALLESDKYTKEELLAFLGATQYWLAAVFISIDGFVDVYREQKRISEAPKPSRIVVPEKRIIT